MRLAPVFLGSLARRRVATLFSFAAIVLGVALGMAVQAVHEAALSEFSRGLRAMAGEADLQVLGPRGGFDENLVENEDVEFSYRLSEAGRRMVFVPEAQVQHEPLPVSEGRERERECALT